VTKTFQSCHDWETNFSCLVLKYLPARAFAFHPGPSAFSTPSILKMPAISRLWDLNGCFTTKLMTGADESTPVILRQRLKHQGVIVPPTNWREECMSERRIAVAPGLPVLLNSISFSMLPTMGEPPLIKVWASRTPKMVPG
jgi:hypothetical protein